MKVYLVILDWYYRGEQDIDIAVCSTIEKAKETLKKWAEFELADSWINTLDMEDMERYTNEDTYFDCAYFDCRTTIYIEEKMVDNGINIGL